MVEIVRQDSETLPQKHKVTKVHNSLVQLSAFVFSWQKIIVAAFVLVALSSQGQEVKVRGRFLTDSIKIGQPFPYALAAEYPSEKNILFPDSMFAFTPFELAGKRFFPTQTVDGISRDSVIYYFNSFEIDSVQSLRLPVFVLQAQDCTSVWTEADQVWLKHLVTISTDSIEAANLPLKINAFYEPVAWLFNYPMASIVGGIAIVVLVVAWLVFGKRIRKYFKVRSMRRSFEKYLQSFNDSLDSLKNSYSISSAEKTLSIWKKYLENLEDKPFTKYTSKEILKSSGHDSLAGPLSTVDRLLYAGVRPSSFEAFYELKSYSEDCFYKKLEEVDLTPGPPSDRVIRAGSPKAEGSHSSTPLETK